jgi:ribosomal protein S27E
LWYSTTAVAVDAAILILNNRDGPNTSSRLDAYHSSWAAPMDSSAQVSCEVCGEVADVVQNDHVDPSGQHIQWPKASVKPDGIYFAIQCPKCGERSQRMASRPSEAGD